ncbi:MAG: hypothetical protein BWX86_01024 [Verrucomicrobia bacterium ADurb.Bin122]|nr:MAG: hypothetical protein BWX86_01024 [Verrucomicrobia bacterium ADurb.Bin122]
MRPPRIFDGARHAMAAPDTSIRRLHRAGRVSPKSKGVSQKLRLLRKVLPQPARRGVGQHRHGLHRPRVEMGSHRFSPHRSAIGSPQPAELARHEHTGKPGGILRCARLEAFRFRFKNQPSFRRRLRSLAHGRTHAFIPHPVGKMSRRSAPTSRDGNRQLLDFHSARLSGSRPSHQLNQTPALTRCPRCTATTHEPNPRRDLRHRLRVPYSRVATVSGSAHAFGGGGDAPVRPRMRLQLANRHIQSEAGVVPGDRLLLRRPGHLRLHAHQRRQTHHEQHDKRQRPHNHQQHITGSEAASPFGAGRIHGRAINSTRRTCTRECCSTTAHHHSASLA